MKQRRSKNNKLCSKPCRKIIVPSSIEVEHVIEAANADPKTPITANIAQPVAFTGLRPGELVNLKVSDIDLDRRAISVYSEKSSYRRVIPLCRKASDAIQVLCEQRGDSEYVLGSLAEGRLRRASAQLERIAEKLGLPSISWHSLRRTFVKLLLHGGVDPYAIQSLLGLRRTGMDCLRRYTGPDKDSLS